MWRFHIRKKCILWNLYKYCEDLYIRRFLYCEDLYKYYTVKICILSEDFYKNCEDLYKYYRVKTCT